jgi:hypothetical protein
MAAPHRTASLSEVRNTLNCRLTHQRALLKVRLVPL